MLTEHQLRSRIKKWLATASTSGPAGSLQALTHSDHGLRLQHESMELFKAVNRAFQDARGAAERIYAQGIAIGERAELYEVLYATAAKRLKAVNRVRRVIESWMELVDQAEELRTRVA